MNQLSVPQFAHLSKGHCRSNVKWGPSAGFRHDGSVHETNTTPLRLRRLSRRQLHTMASMLYKRPE